MTELIDYPDSPTELMVAYIGTHWIPFRESNSSYASLYEGPLKKVKHLLGATENREAVVVTAAQYIKHAVEKEIPNGDSDLGKMAAKLLIEMANWKTIAQVYLNAIQPSSKVEPRPMRLPTFDGDPVGQPGTDKPVLDQNAADFLSKKWDDNF